MPANILRELHPVPAAQSGIDDSERHPELIETLRAACRAGRQDSPEIRG